LASDFFSASRISDMGRQQPLKRRLL
jgi:hypothetical protein